MLLTLSCPDRPGIVGAVGGFLAERGGNIVESAQFGDQETQSFFMRVCFESAGATVGEFAQALQPLAAAFGMRTAVSRADHKPRTLILVSRMGHCLNDLLYRREIGDLPIDVVAVASNHRTWEALAESKAVPFRFLPVAEEGKGAGEATLLALVDELGVELVVLARYMQILSPRACSALSGRVINIHHSFLPGFKGARPYHQAHEHGVKLVGATAHYVTEDLDEGPIIEQEVIRVDHMMTPERMASCGRDIEAIVLARAVTWHAERRILINGRRTVVFR